MVGSTLAMPPRMGTSSFSVTDVNNEVVCPLRNQDGSSCRKRCLGEKRYRSMQEHIRRAHPEHYIAKLPATEESFQLMINTPPSERPAVPPSSNTAQQGYGHDRQTFYRDESTAPNTPKPHDEYQVGSLLPAVSAAAALAQLHSHKLEPEWESEIEWLSDTEAHSKAIRSSTEIPPINRPHEPTSEPFPTFQPNGINSSRPRDSFPPILNNSPPGRSSTLPPLQRHGSTRPRKQSVTKRAREPAHRRQKSKEQMHMRRMSYDRKAFSAEPSSGLAAAYGKRWEDLIDAATSATEDVNDDRTPMPQSPYIPHSPINRGSMPPFTTPHPLSGYQASPLQRALTPPNYDSGIPEPFPTIESAESGDQFHIERSGLSDSSPSFSQHAVQIYCAACQRVSLLKESYACTECICGICQACVEVLMGEGVGGLAGRRGCPRCSTVGGKFKPFQLDIR